jgi:2'-hydroxyisoflavone reductase
MTSRRHVLQLGAYLAASGVLPAALAESNPKTPKRQAPKSKTLLILGGTGFIGPHLTKEALRLGWQVTHFNRGKRAPGGVSDVETLIGDRNGQIDALRGRKWDVVIDDTGQIPKYVKMSAEMLAPNVGYCLYISSISAYASFAKPNDENSPTGKLTDPNIDKTTDETYGPMKALCEQYSAEAFKGRACIVRPGYIVGPLDGSDRFTYWPVRASKGGEMLAPGTPHDPIQIIDVRDLATWMIKLAQERTTGYFNAISPPRAFTMGDIITASLQASPSAGSKATWVPEDFLAKQWKPEELDLPPWSPMSGETAGASLTSTTRAQKAGLKVRPMQETVNDTLEWFHSLPAERQAKPRAGIDPQKEAGTLRAWHAGSGKKSA